jgi:hypothetical protein
MTPVVRPDALGLVWPTATQSLAETQDTSERKPAAPGSRLASHPAPPFLLTMIVARPAASSPTATQSPGETQDRLLRAVTPEGGTRLAQVAPPVRVARIEAPPCRSLPTATQSSVDQHETSAREGAVAELDVSTQNRPACLAGVGVFRAGAATFRANAPGSAADAAAAAGIATIDATARLTLTPTRTATDETRTVVRHAAAEPIDPPHRTTTQQLGAAWQQIRRAYRQHHRLTVSMPAATAASRTLGKFHRMTERLSRKGNVKTKCLGLAPKASSRARRIRAKLGSHNDGRPAHSHFACPFTRGCSADLATPAGDSLHGSSLARRCGPGAARAGAGGTLTLAEPAVMLNQQLFSSIHLLIASWTRARLTPERALMWDSR